MTPVNLSKFEMNNIVKNELIVQHDTNICDPYLGRSPPGFTILCLAVTGRQNVKKFLNSYI